MTGLIATACSSEDKTDGAAMPVFQEPQSYEIAAGETLQVSFDANMEWTLTSDKQWFKFVDAVGETQSLLGKPGTQKITLKVSAGNLGFEGETATATLAMGGQKSAIFKISRPGRQRALKMYTKDGLSQNAPTIEIPRVEIAYEGGNFYVGFMANFDWRVISAPEWIVVNADRDIRELTGKADAENLNRSQMAIMAVDPMFMHKDNTGEIVLGAQAEGIEFTQSFAITAAGIPALTIKWSMSTMLKNEGFLFAESGKWRKNTGMNNYEEVDVPATCWIRSRNHQYALHFVVWENGAPKEVATPWINLTDDRQGNLSVLAQQNDGKPREAALFVIPEGVEVNYRDYFSAKGVVLGGEFAIKISQDGPEKEKTFVRKYKSSTQYDELEGVEDVSGENLELIKALGIPEETSCQKSFTAEEWGYTDVIPLYNQNIQIIPNDQKLMAELKTIKCYDQTGKELPINATGWASITPKQTAEGLLACVLSGRTDYASLADGGKLLLVFYDTTDAVRSAFIIQKN